MKKIAISDEFAPEMVEFYESKLADYKQKVDEIKEVISELKGTSDGAASKKSAASVEVVAEESKKRGRKPGTPNKTASKKKKSAAGRKPGGSSMKLPYEEFIMDTIRNEERPLSSNQITELLVAHFNLGPEEAEKGKAGVSRYLNTMSTKEGKLDTTPIPNARRGFYYGLPEWYENGNLRSDFAAKIQ